MRRVYAALFAALLILLFSCVPAAPADTDKTSETVTAAKTAADTAAGQPVTDTETQTEDGTEPPSVTREGSAGSPAEKTARVSVGGTVNLGSGAVMVYGKCEEDSDISVSFGDESLTVKADGENFVFSVQIPEKTSVKLKIVASAEGKADSTPVYKTVRYSSGPDDKGLTVTLGSRVVEKKVLPDLYGTNKFDKSQLRAIKELAEGRVVKARRATGKDTEIIYVIAPDPLTVYGEELTEDMISQISEPSARLKQAVKALSEVDGVTVMDLTDVMISHKGDGKLYYKLDSHWTELGAFFGYTALMDRIAERFPAAAPHTLDDYSVEYKEIGDTDMTVYAGVGSEAMFESAPFLSARFSEKTPYGANKEDTARIWSYVNAYFGGVSVTEINEPALPSAVLMFDSYGLNMIAFISEHFRTLAAEPIWRYEADYGLIKEAGADYVIQILAERDLAELLKST